MKKFHSRRWRIRKAYSTAFLVTFSYIRLSFLSKIFGRKYYEKRIINLHIRNAEKVKKTILELQGLFIKVGQLLSILTNFLPEAFQAPLEELQDQVPARPFDTIRERIESELGKPIEELYQTFEKQPIAAASIGQAHRATLADGTEVVVKIQHKDIEKIAEIDLHIMERLIYLFSKYQHINGIEYAYTQVRKMIEEELDFEREASAMQIVKENLKDEVGVVIPTVHPELSAHRVLTTTFCEGVKINNLEKIADWELDRTDIAKRLIRVYAQMVFKDGFYHADPHPGNIFIQQDGTIVILDFGAVATINEQMRKGFQQLIEAIAKNDVEAVVEALKFLGFLTEGQEAARLAKRMVEAFRNFIQNEVQFDGLNFKDIKVNPFETSIFNLLEEVGIRELISTTQVPKDYVLLNRMVTLLIGISTSLDAYMNPLTEVRPYIKEFVIGEQDNIGIAIRDFIQRTATNALSLPDDLRNTLRQFRNSEIEIRTPQIAQGTKLIYLLGQQFIYMLLAMFSFVIYYFSDEKGDVEMTTYSSYASIIFTVLMLRVMYRGRRMNKRL